MQAGASSGRSRTRSNEPATAHFAWPFTVCSTEVPSGAVTRTWPSMVSGMLDMGRTSPRAPSRAPAHFRPATVSPSSSQRVTISRLPMAWSSREPPRPLPGSKRCCMTSRQVRPQSVSSHRADSAIRRSPGGRTPYSSRRRPEDPPSSATVTMAVSSEVSSRRADSEADSPCPPPRATTDGPLSCWLAPAALAGGTRGSGPVSSAIIRGPGPDGWWSR